MFKIFEFIIEVVGWIEIVLSPLMIGFFIGLTIYGFNKNLTGLILGLLVTAIGLAVGIIWATKVWKQRGTNNFLSKIYSTPELDSDDEDKNLKNM